MTAGDVSVERNIAVFIDAENLFKGYGKLEMPDVEMSDVLRLVEEAAAQEAGAGTIGVAKAFADWTRDGVAEFRRDVELSGAKAEQVFASGIATKNAADIELVVDALRCAANEPQLEVFVIVSGDGDFVPLVRRLKEMSKYVITATLEGLGSSEMLRRLSDQFVTIPTTATAARLAAAAAAGPAVMFEPPRAPEPAPARREPRRATRAAAPPERKGEPHKKQAEAKAEPRTSQKKQQPEPQKKKQPEPQKKQQPEPQGKPDWFALSQKIEVVHAGPVSSAQEYKEVILALLEDSRIHSYCDKLVAHGGTLPRLALAIKAGAPELSPSDAGVRNLSRALRFALAGTRYALSQGPDDPQPRLVRRAAQDPDMLPDLPIEDIGGR